jgi:TonB-linked SusC/RagA family outer membrane protein
MRKFLCLLAALLYFTVTAVYSQRSDVTGKVTDATGAPIPGASVKVKGAKSGTSADANGAFKISVPTNATLVISGIGFETKEFSVGGLQTVNISLKQANSALSEVVVTALGIRREKKALGYAVSTVAAKDLELRPDGDIGHILNGKAPGVDVLNTSGLSGAGTNITIRGQSTITGSTTPLFIVDGVPFDGGTNAQAGFDFGNQTASRFLDLDPNNIENVSILKGLSAAVLYGEQARNGVILITTKNGSTRKPNKKLEVTGSQSFFSNKVANLPDYTNKYGGGFDLAPSFAFSNWGSEFKNPPDSLAHPYDRTSLNAAFPQYIGAKYAYKPYNSVEKFFRTGVVSTSSVNVAGGGQNTTFNASYSYMDDEGFTPGNRVYKNNFSLGGTARLADNFTMSGTMNYTITDFQSPITGTSGGSSATYGSVFGDLIYTPRSIDLMGLPYKSPVDGSSVYYRANNGIENPRWITENALQNQTANRLYGNLQAKYDVMKGLSIIYRFGLDQDNQDLSLAVNKGGVSGGPGYVNGLYRTVSSNNLILDHNFIANYNTDLGRNFKLNVDAGAELNDNQYSQFGLKSTQQLVFGLFDHSNFITHDILGEDGSDLDYKVRKKSAGIYLQGTLSYKDYLFVTAGGRNSWVSTLEANNRSIAYPSGSVSFLPTSAFAPLQNNSTLNYLKVRAGYATSAHFPDPYETRASLYTQTNAFVDNHGTVVNSAAISTLVPNPNLKPELIREIEAGIESKLFNNRVNFDLTLYQRTAKDQLLQQGLDPATGYQNIQINAGSVINKGIELALGVTVVRSKDWRWQLDGNFTLNRSKVEDLPSSIKQLAYAGYSNFGNFAVNGQPLGIIYGSYIQRDPKSGKRIVDNNGFYLASSDIGFIGDPNPKYKLSGISTLSYKAFSFRMQWDYTHGGMMSSGTVSALLARGLTKDTDFDRTKPVYWKDAVKQDGTPNDIQQSVDNLYFSSLGFYSNELTMYDATVIRLREASLSYSLPQSLIKKTPFGAISMVLSGQNLWYLAPNFPKYTRFDPETTSTGVGTGKGIELLTGPSSRRIGISVKVSF